MRLAILITFSFLFIFEIDAFSQRREKEEKEKIMPITRAVEGQLITFTNDTLTGKIKIKNAEDYYITSFQFKGSRGKKTYTAYDVRWFMQVVPYPDRDAFGVDKVYFKSGQHPDGENKKVFLPIKE